MVQLRKQRQHRQDLLTLNSSQEAVLRYGRPFFHTGGGSFASIEDLAAAWEIHGERILAEWKDSHEAGTRPFAMWAVELVPNYGPRTTTPRFEELLHQYPRVYGSGGDWHHFGILHTNTTPAFQESEAEYLERHSLLSFDERDELRAREDAWQDGSDPCDT
ncbi:MAG: hypothetical protein NTW96_24985 [Planctomycetia bacterium]|nr:hypothetical protein [Planctomycetia bacterium]